VFVLYWFDKHTPETCSAEKGCCNLQRSYHMSARSFANHFIGANQVNLDEGDPHA
jgi:hypothetical protein